MADILIPPYPRMFNPAPELRQGYPRPAWDYFNAPNRSGYNPDYEKPGDPVGHDALDLAAPKFSSLLAAYCGRVHHLIYPSANPAAGWGVETTQETVGGWWGLRYLHCPENSVTVRVGDLVTAGQIIGQVGDSGIGTNYPHVHLEVRWITNLRSGSTVGQGIPLDPLDFFLLAALPVLWPALLKPGQTHPCVPMLRGLLYGLGYLPTSGGDQKYGIRVITAVRRFQKDTGLTVDGVVGADTRATLAADTTATLNA